jgi:two-component system sensor histidine kinase MtrB
VTLPFGGPRDGGLLAIGPGTGGALAIGPAPVAGDDEPVEVRS